MTMSVLYPGSHDLLDLNASQLALKIARHSPCTACASCSGLRPPRDVEAVLLDMNDKEDEGNSTPADYLDHCDCGHTVSAHGADEAELGHDEFARRGRAAVRLDEILQDVGKLLNFEYADGDIINLRKQMQIPGASLSPVVEPAQLLDGTSSVNGPLSPTSSELSEIPPPNKRRRMSGTSSLSEADDDDDDEEDQPLAARIAQKQNQHPNNSGARTVASGKRSGKKQSSMKSKKQTARASTPPLLDGVTAEPNGLVNGVNGHEPKRRPEERMDQGKLDRLATGVTVDAGGAPSGSPPTKTGKTATVELRKGLIQIVAVENDGKPRSLVILTGLKTIFQKQLPKMPREYIARIVYDLNSKCLAIIKRGYKVVGGICFRPFAQRGFAEIVFFAITSVDQDKGYGGMLMDHFKQHIKTTYPGMMHFLTYADNYAVGYFRKQGFSKNITLDRSVWAGYIKDYEGGTIMQCTMLEKVNYLDRANIIAQQRDAILTKIREKSRSHIVYPGLPQFQDANGSDVSVDPQDVPGLRETGWQLSMATTAMRPTRGAAHHFMQRVLSDLQGHPQAWAFKQPVNKEDVPDYYDVIKQPMDLSLMEHKLETSQYPTLELFLADAQLVFDNCRTYNPEGSIYAKNATKLEKFLEEELAKYREKEN